MQRSIAVLGAGGWGTALALLLAEKKYKVTLWARRPSFADRLASVRENQDYLPGIRLPNSIQITSDLERAVYGCDVLILAVPSMGVRSIARRISTLVHRNQIIVNAAKGLEPDSLCRLSQVIAAELGSAYEDRIVALSGPTHAEEVSRHMFTAAVVSGTGWSSVELAQDVLMAPFFRIYTNPDLTGVEVAGALKNVIALGAGILEGLGLGDNSKAALITRGLAEMARLGVALGANPATFAGLAGLGDLVATCTSPHSRNRRAGIALGQGKPLQAILDASPMVIEGIPATSAAWKMAQEYGVDMPITEQVHRIIFENQKPERSLALLMGRPKKGEFF
ncbi:MAG: NAD(P)H-dependent glycerol-3-phosphate dehydrogenase [Clostridia bacterium]|nr:NAD(P)H-dependent glycerol-3-phosphate dehydrogenase [Clostridia bacterium]